MHDILSNHLAHSTPAERGIVLRRIIQRCREVVNQRPEIEPAPLLVDNTRRFLDGMPVRVDASGWREKTEAAHALLQGALAMQSAVEAEEIEAIRSVLRASADKLHAVTVARRSTTIKKLWPKRKLDVTEEEGRSTIRMILALDFPSPEFEAWESDRAILAEAHGQAIVDAAGVTYSDPDIREQVARETASPSTTSPTAA